MIGVEGMHRGAVWRARRVARRGVCLPRLRAPTYSYWRRLDIGGGRSGLTGLSGLAPEGGGGVEEVVDVADHDGREVDHVQDVLKLLRGLHLLLGGE